MILQLTQTVAIIVLLCIVLVFYQRDTSMYKTVLKISKEAIELMGGFRKEMNQAITVAIHAHEMKFHK